MGGLAGHMAHPWEVDDLSKQDVSNLINDLFTDRIAGITEKLDGFNILATLNEQGEVVLCRNSKDINSERGGIPLDDIPERWKDKPVALAAYSMAGKVIKDVFEALGSGFFNPAAYVRKFINTECILKGITNTLPYAHDLVSFHNVFVYTKTYTMGWVHTRTCTEDLTEVGLACIGVENAQVTPAIIVDTAGSELSCKMYQQWWDQLMGNHKTVGGYKFKKFREWCEARDLSWIFESSGGVWALYDRWFNGECYINLRELKKLYRGHTLELDALCKNDYKDLIIYCTEELDNFFLHLGNTIISMCRGLANQGERSAIKQQLGAELKRVCRDIETNGSERSRSNMLHQLQRLGRLGGTINCTEGICFEYKGKMMKLTGSYGPINRILGDYKYSH